MIVPNLALSLSFASCHSPPGLSSPTVCTPDGCTPKSISSRHDAYPSGTKRCSHPPWVFECKRPQNPIPKGEFIFPITPRNRQKGFQSALKQDLGWRTNETHKGTWPLSEGFVWRAGQLSRRSRAGLPLLGHRKWRTCLSVPVSEWQA